MQVEVSKAEAIEVLGALVEGNVFCDLKCCPEMEKTIDGCCDVRVSCDGEAHGGVLVSKLLFWLPKPLEGAVQGDARVE